MKKVSIRILVVILLSMGIQIVGHSQTMVAAVVQEEVPVHK